MIRAIVAIGGGEIRTRGTAAIDREIIRLTHGAGCNAAEHPESRRPARDGPCSFWRDDRFGRRVPADATDPKPPVRRGSNGPIHFCRNCPLARADRPARQLHSSATRRSNRPPDLAALRLASILSASGYSHSFVPATRFGGN